MKPFRPLSLALLVALPAVAHAQPTVVTLTDLKPRQVQSAVFTLTSPQDLHVNAIGAEAATQGGAFGWIATMWSPKEEQREPWMGNAWILDLSTRKVVWELSGASTHRGNRSLRAFDGSVRLPAGTYEAFYSAFPTMYWTDGDGEQNTAQKLVSWMADQGWNEFRLSIQGNARVLAGSEAERARRSLETNAVVTVRGHRA